MLNLSFDSGHAETGCGAKKASGFGLRLSCGSMFILVEWGNGDGKFALLVVVNCSRTKLESVFLSYLSRSAKCFIVCFCAFVLEHFLFSLDLCETSIAPIPILILLLIYRGVCNCV